MDAVPNQQALSFEPFAIIVMGVSGSGKSTLAAHLADEIGCPFIEGDQFHAPEAVAKMSCGIPLDDADRWPWLDRLTSAANSALEANSISVLACSALRKVYRDRLRAAITARTLFVFPVSTPADLLDRIERRQNHFMSAALLESQLATLEHPGDEIDTLVLNGGRPAAQLCEDVLAFFAACTGHAALRA